MSRRSRSAAAVATAVAALLLAAGCSSGGGDSATDGTGVTLPSSFEVSPHGTTATTAPGGTGSTSSTATTTPALEGATIVESLQAAPVSTTCTGGTVPVVVTFAVRSARPVRVYSVYLDGVSESPSASSNSPEPLTIPAVPCDGQSHQVLLIAAVDQDDVATQSAAFRAPGPA